MSKVETVLWKDLKFRYSPNDNYHGTCYYGAMRLLLEDKFDEIFSTLLVKEAISNHSTNLNEIQPFAKYANSSDDYLFLDPSESLHDEEGVLTVCNDKGAHIVYFKNGEYYDDYMSLSCLKDLAPVLIIVKAKKGDN